MRSDDLTPGSDYFLAGERERIVRVLDTPSELRSRARVRVEFLNGVKAGQVAELPTRRIAAYVAPLEVEPKVARVAPRRDEVIRITRRPRIGDEVVWKDVTGDVVWTVTSIEGPIATVSSELFTRPWTSIVPLEDLEVKPIVRERAAKIEVDPIIPAPDLVIAVPIPQPHKFTPQKPRRELDEVLDGLIFTRGCLGVYQQRLAPKVSWRTVNETLRTEIRSRGDILRNGYGGPVEQMACYGRVRVERRFDVVLERKPARDEFELIERLRVWSKPSRSHPRQAWR